MRLTSVMTVAAAMPRINRRRYGATEQRERAGRESRRLAHRLDTGALDTRDLPVATLLHPARHGDVRGAEGHPFLGQAEGVVQVRERVQLHRRAVPGRLDAPAQLRRQPGRLAGVARDDVAIRVVCGSAHVRDPVQVWTTKRPSRSGTAPGRPDHDMQSWTSRVLAS